jgi:N-acetylglutamate synthase-like GNAT family acetyltransferase
MELVRKLNKDEEIPYELLLLADEAIEAINKYINDSDIYVAERDDKIIAIYVFQKITNDIIEIKNIAVDLKYQGQRIGTFLLADASERSKLQGFKEIIIGTGDASIRQLQLYQKEGFEIFDVKNRFFLDNYPEPIFENGIKLKHMIMLKKLLE